MRGTRQWSSGTARLEEGPSQRQGCGSRGVCVCVGGWVGGWVCVMVSPSGPLLGRGGGGSRLAVEGRSCGLSAPPAGDCSHVFSSPATTLRPPHPPYDFEGWLCAVPGAPAVWRWTPGAGPADPPRGRGSFLAARTAPACPSAVCGTEREGGGGGGKCLQDGPAA